MTGTDDSSESARTPVPGSRREAAPEVADATPLDPSTPIELTVVLRRRADGELGADPGDLEAVRSALEAAGLEIVATDAASRRIRVRGAAEVVSSAFGTELQQVTSLAPDGSRVTHRQRTGDLSVPAAVGDRVIAVLGIDDRPQTLASPALLRPTLGR